MSDTRIFDWLDCDGRYPLLYVKSLGLRWGNDEETEAIIFRFQEVAEHLQLEPDYWSAILRGRAWRDPLIGCICVLVSPHPDQNHFDDLAFNFKQGNWVVPQIAATMGLKYPDLAHRFFPEYLASIRSEPTAIQFHIKSIISAQCVLSKLGVSIEVTQFEESSELVEDDIQTATWVVDCYWEFWSTRLLGE
jgi:hypothetical protein